MAGRLRNRESALSPWPGYVDALSTLLMVIIFVLLVFVLAQAFLSLALSRRDQALTQLNQQVAQISQMLSLERGKATDLQASVAGLDRELAASAASRQDLEQKLAAMQANSRKLAADRDALAAAKQALAAQLADQTAQAQSAGARASALQSQLAQAAIKADAEGQASAAVAGQLNDARAELAAARAQLAQMKVQMATLDRTVAVGKATIAEKLSDLAKLANQVEALTALRDQLERQTQQAAAKSLTDQQMRAAMAAELAGEQKFSTSAKAQIALLNAQVSQMRQQLAAVSAALGVAEKTDVGKDVQIADLGRRLNIALASKVQELEKYRSDFLGKLRAVLANRSGIRVVGDRFVFQSEVLFPSGSADLSAAGTDQINQIATTIKQIAKEIPPGLHWILRVDGHTDREAVLNGTYADNWDLSAARAINVVKLLIADGVPPNRLAAAAFAQYQPLDPVHTPAAYAKNRRIELRLTER
ncbi:MAG TPA: peptidoglycan -binding protein [Acetobacteraceae bacterium]|nr:peptidoglycan -binding protein [Acetobacteraceae bacterium]